MFLGARVGPWVGLLILREQAMCVWIASLFLTPDTTGGVNKYSSDHGEACSLDPWMPVEIFGLYLESTKEPRRVDK